MAVTGADFAQRIVRIFVSATDRFVGNIDAARRQHLLNVAQNQRKSEIAFMGFTL
jgi:hypothetical protein